MTLKVDTDALKSVAGDFGRYVSDLASMKIGSSLSGLQGALTGLNCGSACADVGGLLESASKKIGEDYDKFSENLKNAADKYENIDNEQSKKIKDSTGGNNGAAKDSPGSNTDSPSKTPSGPGDDDPVPGPNQKPGDPGYQVPHAPGDPADYPAYPGWKTNAQGMENPPGYPAVPPGAQRDQNWRNYLDGKLANGQPDPSRPAGTPPPAYPNTNAVTDKRLKIIGAAEAQQGTRYVWGGGSINGTTQSGIHDGGEADQRQDYLHRGFDCSGLSEYSIYQATGFDPGHYSGSQYTNLTSGAHPFGSTPIPPSWNLDTSKLQPGDIIYYDGTTGTPGGEHVAIYMGNGVTVETNESGTPAHSQRVDTSGDGGMIRVVRPN